MILVALLFAQDIDAILADAWKKEGVTPAPLCRDGEFLRRASLDLTGRIPTLPELRAFLDKPDRRAKIDELLQSPEFARFWSEAWTTMLNGYSGAFESSREGLRLWLERQFRENVSWDRIASELIAAAGTSNVDGPVNFILHNSVEPVIKVSRVFLGIRLDCARCHDHPYDAWKQKDYQDMARFFEPLRRESLTAGTTRVKDVISGAEKPRFLTGARPVTTRWRDEFAYFAGRSKPFARAFANRIWYHLMGRGVVDPPDDFNAQHQPSVPGLLESLQESGADVRALIRRICLSDAYRRSSQRERMDPHREGLFAYRSLKPMTPEQVYDSLVTALGDRLRPPRAAFVRTLVGRSFGEDFTNLWRYRETVQDVMSRLTIDLPTPTRDVEELYLRILSRPPTAKERELCRGRDAADIIFALANSNEFFFGR